MSEGILISDGYSFLGADFSVEAITKQANFNNGVKLKILNSVNNITNILNYITQRKEVYQFYLTDPFFETTMENVIHVKIQISQLTDIKQII